MSFHAIARHESLFGPPSEVISIADFIQASSEARLSLDNGEGVDALVPAVSSDVRESIAAECSVDDIKDEISKVSSDPRLYAHIRHVHDSAVLPIFESFQKTNKKKRKREVVASKDVEDVPELAAFKTKIAGIPLKSWPLTRDAGLFIRGPKNTDVNALKDIKRSADGSDASAGAVVLTITVYNRLSWNGSAASRNSQHAVLSSQTLGDLFDAIPCTSNELPKEQHERGIFKGCDTVQSPALSGCVVLIEGTAYGDGLNEVDYADKLTRTAFVSPPPAKGTKMHDTLFSSLSLRLHEPYWLLHQGNCEHFLVFDEIRLLHSDDPSTGYPLTLQITPPLLDLCRACTKVPAVYSIVGDVRLGESPCLLCATCWKVMGFPNDHEALGIMVVPLPKHEYA